MANVRQRLGREGHQCREALQFNASEESRMTALDRRQMAQTLVIAALVVAAIFAAGYFAGGCP